MATTTITTALRTRSGRTYTVLASGTQQPCAKSVALYESAQTQSASPLQVDHAAQPSITPRSSEANKIVDTVLHGLNPSNLNQQGVGHFKVALTPMLCRVCAQIQYRYSQVWTPNPLQQ